MLVAVSVGSKYMLAVDISSGSLLYSRTFLSAEPFAITVYDNESVRSFSSKWFKYNTFVWNSHHTTCTIFMISTPTTSWKVQKSWIYKKALEITNDTNNKVKYCQIFGTIHPFFRTIKKKLHMKREKHLHN